MNKKLIKIMDKSLCNSCIYLIYNNISKTFSLKLSTM